jgi:hypothetical protein
MVATNAAATPCPSDSAPSAASSVTGISTRMWQQSPKKMLSKNRDRLLKGSLPASQN